LQNEFFLRAQALLANLNSIPFPQHDFPTHKHLLHSLALGFAREYSWVACALVPFPFTSMSFDTTLTFTTLHLEIDVYFSFFLEDYKLDQDLKLSSDSFKLVIKCMSHLLASGLSRMLFEHL